jgi:hypothetical protein
MSKEFKNVQVYDILFYLTDDDGNELLNDDYTAKLFRVGLTNYEYENGEDFSYIAERFELGDLEEVDR